MVSSTEQFILVGLKAIKVIIVLVFGFESLNKLGSTWNGRHEL